MEEQFDQLAADVSLSAVMEEAESVPFIDESISESTSSASATAVGTAKDPSVKKEVSLPLKNVCRPATAQAVTVVQASAETEDVRNDLEEEIQFDPTVSSGHLGYNLDVSYRWMTYIYCEKWALVGNRHSQYCWHIRHLAA